jgi:signal peptidase I
VKFSVKKDLRGTWPQALVSFLFPLVLIFVVRWLLFEPYVIPSESMLPNLMVHDHIFVSKLAFGIRLPFSEKWLVQWRAPQRGEIVVFKYPVNKDVFFVKRVIGLPGDEIRVEDNRLFVNGQEWTKSPNNSEFPDDSNTGFSYFTENNGERSYTVRLLKGRQESNTYGPITVPDGHFFALGDNRDQSSDSRVWGFVPVDHLMGTASLIWLSCEETLPSAEFVCDPKTLRWSRFFLKVK